MKKLIYIAFGVSSVSFAQMATEDHTHDLANPQFCSSTEQQEKLFEAHPEYKEMYDAEQAAFQAEYEEYWEHYSEGDRATYIIPMAVHVVHLGGDENISDEQIYNAIENLNMDFSESNVDLGATIPEFAGITGDVDFEFRLAKKDPNGNCHSGITRTYSSTTYDEGMGFSSHPIVEAVKSEHGTWPQNRYMNVYVCIDPAGAAGYTYKPAGWIPTTDMYAGIFMRHDYMGAIGTSNSGRRHTLSHEAGHWFNLDHCWGGSNSPADPSNCTINDGVPDTPNTIGWSSCNLSGSSCGSLDNVQNFMEYSYCSTMFTDGQAARMQTAINSSTAGRSNLWTGANLSATGVLGSGELCEADFNADKTLICGGSSVNFSDASFFNVTGWEWEFEGGTPSSSTAENPTVTYNTGGTYDVTLTVTDGVDFETVTLTNYITVLANPGDPLPYSEGFETLDEMTDDMRFFIENENGDDEWEVTDEAASLGSKCAFLDNFANTDETKDAFISSPIDLSGVDASDAMIMSFDYAYKKRTASNDEELRVYVSHNCGESWALRLILDSDDMTEDVLVSPYTPEGSGEWKNEVITTITSAFYVSNFMYKFEFTNGSGNNVYVDNINLYPASMSDIVEASQNHNISVYPNPTNDMVTVEIDGSSDGDVTVELYDALGSKVGNIYNGPLSSTTNKLNYSTASLAKGVYLIKVNGAGQSQTIKLIKE
jgi:PKD repeat protein